MSTLTSLQNFRKQYRTVHGDGCWTLRQEKKAASEIVAVSIGPKAAMDTIRTALAMGADRGIHVTTDEAVRIDQGLEPLAVAGLLKKVCVLTVA